MSLQVKGRTIQTNEEGYLIDPEDWDHDVMDVLIKQHEAEGHKPLSETAIGLIDYFREYYGEYQKHPTMNQLIKELGMRQADNFSEAEEYKTFLYEMFPHGPIQMLSKLSGLPSPGNENES
jgi:tRNA 2-thiouridine synthesizing protein E